MFWRWKFTFLLGIFLISAGIPFPSLGQVFHQTPDQLQSPPLLEVPPKEKSPQQLTPVETLPVQQIQIQGSSKVFSRQELLQMLQNFFQTQAIDITETESGLTFILPDRRQMSLSDLINLENAITDRYLELGYINSGAVVPVQSLGENRVVIVLAEGGLESIKVTGVERLDPDFIRSRVAKAIEPLNRNQLLQALQLLQQEDRLIASISAELSPGVRPDRSILEIRVVEKDPFVAKLLLDNGRSPSVGSFRRGLELSYANFSGRGDELSLGYGNTDGSNVYDLSYSLPVNPDRGTLTLSFSQSNSNVVEPPFDRLSILGDANTYDLSYRQPLWRTPTQEFALGGTISHQTSQTKLLGESFQLSPGADSQGKTRSTTLRFFQDYVTRNSREVFALRSQFSLGVGWLNSTINPEPPDSRFFAWRGQAQYLQQLAPDSLFVTRADIQLSDRPLLPFEQFGAGGLRSVRGYRQDALITDNGVFATGELQLPIIRFGEGNLVQIIPFLDFVTAWNNSRTSRSGSLLSAGLGLQLRLTDRFVARLDAGIPLLERDASGNNLPTNNLFFSVEYRGF